MLKSERTALGQFPFLFVERGFSTRVTELNLAVG